jgi:hypothetical protein
MEVLILLGALLAFWIFVIWDRRNIELQPVDTSSWYRKVSQKALAMLGVSLMCLILAGSEFGQPSAAPFKGRLSLVKQVLFDCCGPYGFAGFLLVLSILFACCAWKLRKRRV